MTTKSKDENPGIPSVDAVVWLFPGSLESYSSYCEASAERASPTVLESGLRIQVLAGLARPKLWISHF